METTYILKTQSGADWMAFDREDRARAVLSERAEKQVRLRLFRKVTIKEEIT